MTSSMNIDSFGMREGFDRKNVLLAPGEEGCVGLAKSSTWIVPHVEQMTRWP